MCRYFIFRINYDSDYKMIRSELINNHILRQGWGAPNMQINEGFDHFKEGWLQNWGSENPTEKTMRSRFNNLVTMLEIQPGDVIVIPKVNDRDDLDYVCQSFIIAKCKRSYYFSLPGDELLDVDKKDFGHVIEVEDVFGCEYDVNIYSKRVKNRFSAYRRPVNLIKYEGNNCAFIDAVNELIKTHKDSPELLDTKLPNITTMIRKDSNEARLGYLQTVLKGLREIDNRDFEDVIAELFEKNGYALVGRNQYDRKGGDVDLIFESCKHDSLMHHIFETCGDMSHIYVQAKKKKGKDAKDIIGVEQLKKMRSRIKENNATLILINLTDKFSNEAMAEASENGIILINGITFASILVGYGIDPTLS